MSNPHDLQPTHLQALTHNNMNILINDLRVKGIQEPISYIEYNGQMYEVDGHHCLLVAKRLRPTGAPIQEAKLSYTE